MCDQDRRTVLDPFEKRHTQKYIWKASPWPGITVCEEATFLFLFMFNINIKYKQE